MIGTGGLDPAEMVDSGDQLARFADAIDPAGTLDRITMIAQHPGSRARMRELYPRLSLIWEIWSSLAEHPTAGHLASLVDLAIVEVRPEAATSAR